VSVKISLRPVGTPIAQPRAGVPLTRLIRYMDGGEWVGLGGADHAFEAAAS
jgi:hypothetical protein